MRVLVHGSGLDPGSRLALAAAGLALRGHAVTWSGGSLPRAAEGGSRAPTDLAHIAGGLAVARQRADVVVGDGRAPLAAALAGWMSGARALVLALEAARLRRWGWGARWAWGSLHASGLVEAAEAGGLQQAPPPVPLERLAMWSEEPPPAVAEAEHPDAEILERACERALARHRTRGVRGAVFADRDGTLVVERGYLSDPDDLALLPGVPEAIQALRSAGLAVVVVSNQSGVGRGLFPLSRVYEAMARLRHALRARGAEVDAIYFCPHRPESGCACRKPGIELLERAADDLQLSLTRSVFVGDKLLDVRTGHNAGAAAVLVRTGYGRDEERQLAAADAPDRPERVCDDFAAAAEWILATAELERP
ncbi:MAG TPA: HAD family hydrolase [Candidatus Eisenbacteria bacterium]